MISSKVISLIKNNMTNPSNGVANISASFSISDPTQVTTLTPALKCAQNPETVKTSLDEDLLRQRGSGACLVSRRCSE